MGGVVRPPKKAAGVNTRKEGTGEMRGLILRPIEVKELSDKGIVAIMRPFASHRSPPIILENRFYIKEPWEAHIYHTCGGMSCECDTVAITYCDGSTQTFWDGDIDSDWTFPKVTTANNFPQWAARLFVNVEKREIIPCNTCKSGHKYKIVLKSAQRNNYE